MPAIAGTVVVLAGVLGAGLTGAAPHDRLALARAHPAAGRSVRSFERGPREVAAAELPPPAPVAAAPESTLPPVAPPPAGVRSIDGSVASVGDVEAQAGEATAAAQAAAAAASAPVPELRPPLSDADLADPAVVFDGDRTLVFATGSEGRNVSVVVSGDRSTWSAPAEALPNLPAWSRPGLTWAPSVARIGGRWVLYVGAQNDGVGDHCVARAVADRAEGPYTIVGDQPLVCGVAGGRGAIDPYPFVDTDGRAYLLWKNVGDRGQQLFSAALSPDGLQLAGRPVHLLTATSRWEAGGIENPTMVTGGGRHWLVYSANWWLDGRYAMGFADCAGPLGPCRKVTTGGPWISSADGAIGPGAGSIAVDRDGTPWMSYAAWDRPEGLRGGGRRLLRLEPLAVDGNGPRLADRPPGGRLDRLLRVPGGIGAIGWALDPDVGRPIPAIITVDGRTAAMASADGARSDVAAAAPGYGPRHGFWAVAPVSAGHHQVCAFAANDRDGAPTAIGCYGVDVSTVPHGYLDRADGTIGGARLTGWAIDPDTASPVTVRVDVDGQPVTTIVAAGRRDDVAGAYPGYGANHGWALDVHLAAGDHRICAVGLDTAGGAPGPLGCRTVHVSLTTPIG